MTAAVVFDLDGTLVDSSADITACMSRALETLGYAPPRTGVVEALIGRPIEEVFEACAPGCDPVPLIAEYRRRFAQEGLAGTRAFPGVIDLLKSLRAADVPLAVATTKGSRAARHVVEGTGLGRYFLHIQGTDGFPAKPAPDVVRHALIGLGLHDVDPGGCWMVGDTSADIVAGGSAGLRTAAVTHGTHDRVVLASAGADVVVDDIAELAEVLLG